jgi:hypothetical protein
LTAGTAAAGGNVGKGLFRKSCHGGVLFLQPALDIGAFKVGELSCE